MPELTLAQAIRSGIDAALADPAVVVLGEDVGMTGGVFRVTDGLQEQYGPDRVIDTPVAESGIVGAALAVGLIGLIIEVLLLRRLYHTPELFILFATFLPILEAGNVF